MSESEFSTMTQQFVLNAASRMIEAVSYATDEEQRVARKLMVDLRDLLERYAAFSPDFAALSADVRAQLEQMLGDDEA